MADRKVFTKAQLHGFKKADNDLSTVRAKFPWAQPNHLVRFGGIYTQGHDVPVSIADNDIIRVTQDPIGCMGLSFSMRDQRGRLVAAMENNMFQATPNLLSDLHVDTGATKIRFRMKGGDAKLDLSFRFVTIDELKEMLVHDEARAQAAYKKLLPNFTCSTANPLFSREEIPQPEFKFKVAESVIERARTRCLNEEGRISLLDFRNVVSYIDGRKLEIRDRLVYEGLSVQFSAIFR